MRQVYLRMQNKPPHLMNNPYQKLQNTPGNPRQSEARALLEAARRLSVAQKQPEDKKMWEEALRFNWKLWTIFQADFLEEGNPLPNDIKINLLNLSRFIDQRTLSLLSDHIHKPERLEILININRNIANGLLESLKNSQAQPGTATPPASTQSI